MLCRAFWVSRCPPGTLGVTPSPLWGEGWGEGDALAVNLSALTLTLVWGFRCQVQSCHMFLFLSFRAFCGGGRNATLGVPAKRKRALLRSNLPRNSRPETNCDATGAGEQPLVGVCVDHLNFASSCWHH